MLRLVLLATTPHGKEERGAEEIGNTLFRLDSQVDVRLTRFPGVLLVYSERLTPDQAFRALSSRYLSWVARVVPTHTVLEGPDPEMLATTVARLVERRGGTLYRLDCSFRGFKLSCTELKRRVAEILGAGYRFEPRNPQICVRVESVDRLVVVGVLSCSKG